eukprot:359620-Chlamydomonas_euryale.AAC.2
MAACVTGAEVSATLRVRGAMLCAARERCPALPPSHPAGCVWELPSPSQPGRAQEVPSFLAVCV